MTQAMEWIVRAALIGIGATVTMDLWAIFLKRCFGIPSLSYAMVGRWIGHLPRGQWVHQSIARSPPVRAENIVGWTAHYLIGVLFAALLLMVFGLDWARQPTLGPALIVGVATLTAPFLVLQPGMGAGIAASKTPKPNIARLKSLATHLVFGLGLFGAAVLSTLLMTP
jgi:Protein of unknown function (DUF2938)